MCVLAVPATTCAIVTAMSAEPATPKSLDDVYAPVVVGTPPVNAFNGLLRGANGEIRHYGDGNKFCCGVQDALRRIHMAAAKRVPESTEQAYHAKQTTYHENTYRSSNHCIGSLHGPGYRIPRSANGRSRKPGHEISPLQDNIYRGSDCSTR